MGMKEMWWELWWARKAEQWEANWEVHLAGGRDLWKVLVWEDETAPPYRDTS
jgi:hypothetical protein